MKLTVNGRSYEVEVLPDAVVVDGVSYKTAVAQDNGDAAGVTTVRVSGRPYRVKVQDEASVLVDGRPMKVELTGKPAAPRAAKAPPKKQAGSAGKADGGAAGAAGAVAAMMPGTIIDVLVRPGDQVAAGAVLLILEAMKMRNEIKAPAAGVVQQVAVTPGQTVGKGDLMVVVS